jgi:hypothetical protein
MPPYPARPLPRRLITAVAGRMALLGVMTQGDRHASSSMDAMAVHDLRNR